MIGDILDDIEAGRRAGCRTVLLDVGNETVWRHSPLRTPHVRARDLLEAARYVVAHQENFQRKGAEDAKDAKENRAASSSGFFAPFALFASLR
jgi:hypothetical protein